MVITAHPLKAQRGQLVASYGYPLIPDRERLWGFHHVSGHSKANSPDRSIELVTFHIFCLLESRSMRPYPWVICYGSFLLFHSLILKK
ncbi:hypothetical protein C1H46_021532 [Malus baccata]|uniref:Uncharacterized protein n=1 Tax=Malus baccata TaxID=106549 RepID=A0A540M2Y5_MALBA|nr:hypothetical protein C1H46_021532 [Malus baccata]